MEVEFNFHEFFANHSSRFFNKFEAGQDLWWLSRGQIFYLIICLFKGIYKVNSFSFLEQLNCILDYGKGMHMWNKILLQRLL